LNIIRIPTVQGSALFAVGAKQGGWISRKIVA